MAVTFKALATVTVGSGGASSIDFTSIPSTYTDLCLVFSVRTDGTNIVEDVRITFNGSGGTAYSRIVLRADGSNAYSNSSTSQAYIQTPLAPGTSVTANTFSNNAIYVPNYAGSNNKSLSIDAAVENNAGQSELELVAGLWSNTSAITQMTLGLTGTLKFVQYSTATLYGIKNS